MPVKSPAMPTFPRREKSTFAGGAGVTSKALALDGEEARAIVVKIVDIDENNDVWRAAWERRRGEGMAAVFLAVTGVGVFTGHNANCSPETGLGV